MLAELSCHSFRNLETSIWRPGAGCHLILGANGAGKTSLLEAVYLLATTRSFRTSQVMDCAHHDAGEFHLSGEVEAEQRVSLQVGLGEAGRYRSVNGSAGSLVDHLRVMPVVAWTEEDKQILTGPPARRRRFMDQGIVAVQPVALETLSRFRRALSQKRSLLMTGGKGLGPWNELLAAPAAELMKLRRGFVSRLSTALVAVMARTELDLPEIRLEYRPSIDVSNDDPAEVLASIERAEASERRQGRPLIGPQRDEMRIVWGRRGIRRVASAGERKAVGLLLTVARGRLLEAAQRCPVYLLDDADSELDQGRLEAVWKAFSAAKQVLVSSSRPEVWSLAPEAVRWHLEAGSIGPASSR